MKRFVCSLASAAALACTLPTLLSAAEPRTVTLVQNGRLSAHDTISRRADGNRVTIIYGRPTVKDPRSGQPRTVWGGHLVPMDKIWRLGADEATTLITQKEIDVGGLKVPAGAYTLFLYYGADGSAQLLVNREIGQWGIDPYHAASELGRVPLQKKQLSEPVERFTIALEKGEGSNGVLALRWADAEYSTPYSVAP